jgi:hypothetical protein
MMTPSAVSSAPLKSPNQDMFTRELHLKSQTVICIDQGLGAEIIYRHGSAIITTLWKGTQCPHTRIKKLSDSDVIYEWKK